MISRRFMEKFNRITYAAMLVTIVIVSLELVWWVIGIFN